MMGSDLKCRVRSGITDGVPLVVYGFGCPDHDLRYWAFSKEGEVMSHLEIVARDPDATPVLVRGDLCVCDICGKQLAYCQPGCIAMDVEVRDESLLELYAIASAIRCFNSSNIKMVGLKPLSWAMMARSHDIHRSQYPTIPRISDEPGPLDEITG